MNRRRWVGWVGMLAVAVAGTTGAQVAGAQGARAEGLICRWTGDGNARDALREIDGQVYGGVTYVPARVGKGFFFNGTDGAVNVPDAEPLRLTKSLSISAWVRVDSYPAEEQDYGQIVFRGDERGGNDPYFLGVRHNGDIVFGVDSGNGYADVKTHIPLDWFIHVTASLDDATGRMLLLFDGRVMALNTTDVRPFRDLDPTAHPGVGIGNHACRPESRWNQPFHGIIDEVEISDRPTRPRRRSEPAPDAAPKE
jgi:hypothetical protein